MTLPPGGRDESDAALASARDASPVPGQLLGNKYRIEARVAEGGMGVVLRATHLDLDCPVAIKLIRPEHTGNEDVIARLLAEARIAAGLRSKHVNQVLDVGRTSTGLPYLVLEYMEGSDLRCHLEKHGPLPIEEAVDYAMQTCEALAEAHAMGIVHRDIKPENLFLCEDADGGCVLKVLDFGISKAPAARRGGRTLTNPFELVGSPNYMAPEQIPCEQVDSRADVWALGVLLYELCTGDVPFTGETVTETFSAIIAARYEPLRLEGPGSEHLELVIARCLRRDVQERYQSVVELADALSPLGTDLVQGRRVAKVALATRARLIAAGGAVPDNTPLALSASLQPEPAAEVMTPPRRARGKWLLLAAAAVVPLLALGAYLAPSSAPRADIDAAAMAQSERDADPVWASASATSAEIQRPVSEPMLAPLQADSSPAARTAVTGASAALSAAKPKPYARPSRPAVAAPDHALEAPSAVTTPALVASAEPPATAAEVEPDVEPADAWDPNTFGGRR